MTQKPAADPVIAAFRQLAEQGSKTALVARAVRLGANESTLWGWLKGPAPASVRRSRTYDILSELLTGSASAKPDIRFGGSAAVEFRSAGYPLHESVRIWILKFLQKLTEAGSTEEEVDEARMLLTKSAQLTYAHGGAPGQEQLSEDERLQVVKLIAESAIIPRLKRMGRKVNASFAR